MEYKGNVIEGGGTSFAEKHTPCADERGAQRSKGDRGS
jgi:hypothetical protein